ncbi:MAG: tRNA (N6-isopentenyl adenosine(37)-C2)-methylthiotransferase MiaB [Proteobacteria bacterium]|nr:tRNA (N6-isopentenyl adenosine(37)-C2)-methylthiotransferase MiaB [Pseudomonadota bacterium]
MQKKLHITTYGCQMNEYDSAKMAALLAPHGFQMTSILEEADMVIVNTCHVREKAAERVYSTLGRIAKLKKRKQDAGSNMIIVVAGCVAQAEGEEVVRRAPFVDIVVGPQSYTKLPVLLEQIRRLGDHAVSLDFAPNAKFDSLMELVDVNNAKSAYSAFLSVQEGCDKFCHFCVVPYTRGGEYSRPVSEILKEAQIAVDRGVKEITLLGQNVSAYRGFIEIGCTGHYHNSHAIKDSTIEKFNKEPIVVGLGTLIQELAKISGLHRIRYITSHPIDMTDETLFEAHATEPKLMPYVHLPVQSGSDKILKAMNRKHNIQYYMDIISKFKSAASDIALSSDFIVGYPGETEQDFLDTMELVKRVNYAQAYSFKYSQRPGTPASALPNQVDENVKSERLARLQELLKKQQKDFNNCCIGKSLSVLIEKDGRSKDKNSDSKNHNNPLNHSKNVMKKQNRDEEISQINHSITSGSDNQVVGKSQYMQSVIINAKENKQDMFGKIVNVRIKSASQNSLRGEIEKDT